MTEVEQAPSALAWRRPARRVRLTDTRIPRGPLADSISAPPRKAFPGGVRHFGNVGTCR
jgi:hypothetical protein